MDKRDIVKVCLEIVFGGEPKQSLKGFINNALDMGEYYDGFEIAISKTDLSHKEYDDLYASFTSAYGGDIPDMTIIEKLIDEYLPQSYFSNTSWLVSNCGEIYATDGLRVAKIYGNKILWVTKRISYDGINLTKLTDDELQGKWYSPVDENCPWSELILSTENGALIKGEVIEFREV